MKTAHSHVKSNHYSVRLGPEPKIDIGGDSIDRGKPQILYKRMAQNVRIINKVSRESLFVPFHFIEHQLFHNDYFFLLSIRHPSGKFRMFSTKCRT
jgi:hypothetical protein